MFLLYYYYCLRFKLHTEPEYIFRYFEDSWFNVNHVNILKIYSHFPCCLSVVAPSVGGGGTASERLNIKKTKLLNPKSFTALQLPQCISSPPSCTRRSVWGRNRKRVGVDAGGNDVTSCLLGSVLHHVLLGLVHLPDGNLQDRRGSLCPLNTHVNNNKHVNKKLGSSGGHFGSRLL